MITFLTLLFAMLCFLSAKRPIVTLSAQRWRRAVAAIATVGSLIICAAGWGVERGVAVWLFSLSAAGMLAPMIASEIPRAVTAFEKRRSRRIAYHPEVLQAAPK